MIKRALMSLLRAIYIYIRYNEKRKVFVSFSERGLLPPWRHINSPSARRKKVNHRTRYTGGGSRDSPTPDPSSCVSVFCAGNSPQPLSLHGWPLHVSPVAALYENTPLSLYFYVYKPQLDTFARLHKIWKAQVNDIYSCERNTKHARCARAQHKGAIMWVVRVVVWK